MRSALFACDSEEGRGTLQPTTSMPTLLRDFLLSFCPARIRQSWPPYSQLTALRAAIWSGAVQFLLIGLLLTNQFKDYFVARAHQFSPHLGGTNTTGQSIIVIMVAFEFLFRPLSLFLLYLAMEGGLRFLGGVIHAEIIPSLLVSLLFKISGSTSKFISRRSNGPPIADFLCRLPDHRIKIASAISKAGWNASVTIGIDGEWFELEREEQAGSPRAHVYFLRPAPPGKILRGYQEYDPSGAVNGNSSMGQGDGAVASSAKNQS